MSSFKQLMCHRDKFYNALSRKETECRHMLTEDPRVYKSQHIPITIEKAKPRKSRQQKQQTDFRDALINLIQKTVSQ